MKLLAVLGKLPNWVVGVGMAFTASCAGLLLMTILFLLLGAWARAGVWMLAGFGLYGWTQ